MEASLYEAENDSCQPDRSFIRMNERKDDISVNQGHNHNTCDRCYRSGTEVFPYPKVEESPFTESGMAMVTALAFDGNRDGSPELCLFAQDLPEEIDVSIRWRRFDVENALSEILKDVSQLDKIYHTIKHPLPSSFAKANAHYEVRWNSVVWNLPLTRYPLDNDQRRVFDNWISLLCEGFFGVWYSDIRDTWNSLQMSLFLLKAGHKWEEVTKTVKNHREEVKKSMERNARIRGLKKVNGIIDMQARLYELYVDKTREKQEKPKAGEFIEPSYYIPSQQRVAGKKLRWRNGNVSEYDGCTFNFLKS